MTLQSQRAYIDIVNTLPERQKEVFNTLKSLPSYKRSIQYVCQRLNKEKHQISGRFTELQDQGLIIESMQLNKRYALFDIVNPLSRENVIRHRENTKFANDTRNYLKKWESKLDPTTILNLSQYL